MFHGIRGGEDKCVWCCQIKDGVDVAFDDGLQGFFCWADFKKAVNARSGMAMPPVPRIVPTLEPGDGQKAGLVEGLE